MTFPELNVGDRVRLTSERSRQEPSYKPYVYYGTAGTGTFVEGETYEVRRVSTNYIWVRIPLLSYVGGPYEPNDGKTTVQIDRAQFVGGSIEPGHETILYVPATDGYTPPRQLGQKPEGDHLDIDDPRIAWIFEDMGRYATKKRYCDQYDKLCDELGIPGREREFTVSTTIPGTTLKVSAKIKATSKKQAEAQLEQQLREVGGTTS